MKNMKKFAAGFIAAAMAMSMSLSAFAEVIAPVQNDDMYDNAGNLVLNVSSDEAQITMMAYLVPAETTLDDIPEYSNQTIIALDQNVGNPGFTTIPVDTTKLSADTSIVVKIGGSNGNVATYLIQLEKEVVTYSVTFNYNGGTGTPESKEFDDDDTIAEVVAGIAPAKDATETETYEFIGWATTADGEVIADTTVPMKSLLAEGETTVTLYAIYEATAIVPTVETLTILVGDINIDTAVNANDTTYLGLYTKIPAAPRYDAQREALKAQYPDYKFAEVYDKADNSGTVVVGDINGDNAVNANDTTYLGLYTKIPAAPRYDAQREALKAQYPDYKFAQSIVVNKKN